MVSILLITVGGSPQPIITAIQSLDPDRTVFICSDGPRGSVSQITGAGEPCEIRRGAEIVSKLPNIPTHLGMGDRFNPDIDLILLDNPDDLAECYGRISKKVSELISIDPNAQIYADYTGGTKTMSLALGAIALDHGLNLYLTTSATRPNLIKVEHGESTERATTTLINVERSLNQTVPMLMEQYNYPAAIAQLQTLLKSLELSPELKQQIRKLRDYCDGLDAWDRFDHAQAWLLLAGQMKQIQQLGLFLKRVMTSRAAIDPKFESTEGIPGHGYEIVQDLMLNAERRAVQKRYDDAVGRIYRALELLAQIRLRQVYGIETGDVEVSKLPKDLQDEYENRRSPHNQKIQLALRNSYELLSQMPNDPLGDLYQQKANGILDALSIRNNSLFAHGFQPISEQEYRVVKNVLGGFIESGIASIVSTRLNHSPIQFPIVMQVGN